MSNTAIKLYEVTVYSPSADLTERCTIAAPAAASAKWQAEAIYGPVFDDAVITVRLSR